MPSDNSTPEELLAQLKRLRRLFDDHEERIQTLEAECGIGADDAPEDEDDDGLEGKPEGDAE